MSIRYNRQYKVAAPQEGDEDVYLGGGGGPSGGGGGGGNTGGGGGGADTGSGDIPIDPLPPFVNYEIAISSNLQEEVGDFIKLKYDILSNGDIQEQGDVLLSDYNTDGLSSLKEVLKSGILNLYLENNLPSNYSISKIYYTNKLIATKNPTDYTKWKVGNGFIGMQASELLTGGVAVAVILEKTINAPKPIISLDFANYSKQIKDSDTDGIINVKFSQTNCDFVDFYIASDKKIRVEAAKGSLELLFKKDFGGVFGSKKIIVVPYSDLYGTGDKSEILLNFISVNDFPSITEITYVDNIDVPSFSDLEIEYEVSYTTFSTSFIDVDLLLKDKTKISLFKKLTPNGSFKINLKQLKDKFAGWNGSDNITIYLKPTNTSGENVLIGNEYEIKTSILYPRLNLNEDIIKKSIYDAFIEKLQIFEPGKESKYLTHLVNFGNDEQIIVSSWENDNWTLSKKSTDELGNEIVKPEDEVKSVILKLYNPLPANITSNSTFWITKLMSNPLIETIVLNAQDDTKCPPIKGPNFDIDVDFVKGNSTSFESLDSLILSGSMSSSANLISTYLSSSLIDTDGLNIQYVSGSTYLWNNFVHFSSAKERVLNFDYKNKLIELYDGLIVSASTYYTASLSSQQELERQTIKKNQIIQSFDGFEKYLKNANVTGSTTLTTLAAEAELYDLENPNYILNNIPQYIVNNENNENFLLFFTMIGQHFDNIYYHTKSIEKSRGLGYKSKDGISNKLLFDALKSMNWDAKNLGTDSKLWEYAFGLDTDGIIKETNPAKQRTYEVWRRIINNLPYLLKHKGTRRGVYALMSCYGIPSSNLSIFEFGGPEVNSTSKSKLVFDNMTTALKMTLTSSVEMDWKITDKGRKPNTIELFLNPTYISGSTIISGSGWNVMLSGSSNSEYGKVIFNYSGSNYISSSLLPIYNDKYFGLSVSSGSTGLKLDLRQSNKEKTIFQQSISASVSSSWNNGSKIKLGGYYTGSVDEFRLWSEVLDTDRFYEHVSFPEMINGNHISSSTNDLYFRLDFEYPKNLAVSQSIINVDTNVYFNGTLTRNNFENGLQIITGSISNITLINGGSGYTSSLGTSNGTIPLYFVGGEFKQIQPSVTGSLTNGVLTSISISHGGTGMVSFPNNLQPSASLSQSINNSITPIVIGLTGSVANFLSENTTPLLSASAYGFDVNANSGSYPYQFEEIDRTVVLEIPDMGSTRYSTNKVRFESQYTLSGEEITGSVGVDLSVKSRATKKAFDQSPTDSNRVGLFFSPTKELNIDIAKSFGGINLDNYIGDPGDRTKSTYKSLDNLRHYYFQRFDNRDIYAYINLIKLYEKSMFEDIKKMLPARVKATTGLLIEPHILERSKIAQKDPTGEDYQKDVTIHYNDTTILSADTNQYETIVNANLSENVVADNYQYYGEVYTASLDTIIGENYQYDSLIQSSTIPTSSANSYQQTASIDAGLDLPTITTEIDLGIETYGQTAFETIGFGIYAQHGNAIRTYFDKNNRRVKERIRVQLITKEKERMITKFAVTASATGMGDPRGGYVSAIQTYNETYLNIQPFSGSTIPTVQNDIIAVQPVDGYLRTHYRNTSDLTRGLENSYYRGSKNTAATTLDGSPPVETFISSPSTLSVNKAGRNTAEPILEVE
jgi:hypothetical protein